MSYLRRLDYLYVFSGAFGDPYRGGEAARIGANVWVFTDGLVVTPLGGGDRPIRALRHLDLETVRPETISALYPHAARLDRDRVVQVEYVGPAGVGRLKRFGLFEALFVLENDRRFILHIRRERNEEVLSLLRDTYPGLVKDHREDLR